MQRVFNQEKAVTYMCAYFSKAEDETSEAMKRAAKAAINGKIKFCENKVNCYGLCNQKRVLCALFKEKCI